MYKRILALIGCLIVAFGLCACAEEAGNSLEINILKIGKADAIILHTNSGAVLIDAGEEDDGAEILKKASKLGIEKFDYMIVTHYDKDHIGGASEVIKGIKIGQIIEPDYIGNSEEFAAYIMAADSEGLTRTSPEQDFIFELDGTKYTVMMPKQEKYEDKNDYSIVVKAEYGGQSALFAGDAIDERIDELMERSNLKADVLKVPHHGSYEKDSKDFLSAVNPKYAVITCSKKNPADEKTLKCLAELGSHVFLTVNGDVKITLSDKGIKATQN